MLYCHLIEAAWAPRSRNCLLSISPSTRSSYFPSLSFYHFSISSHSNLSFPSFLVPLKFFLLHSRCSLSRILLFIWTVALATPCTSARGLLSVDSKDSAFQGLMETEDSENKVEDWEFVRKTSSEGEPSVDESIAMLFDPAILRSETK